MRQEEQITGCKPGAAHRGLGRQCLRVALSLCVLIMLIIPIPNEALFMCCMLSMPHVIQFLQPPPKKLVQLFSHFTGEKNKD